MKILIAEDNPVSGQLLVKTLEKLGHEVLTAEDGLRAGELAQKNKVNGNYRLDDAEDGWIDFMQEDPFFR